MMSRRIPLFLTLAASSVLTASLLAAPLAPQPPKTASTDKKPKAEPRRVLVLPIDTKSERAEALTDAFNAIITRRLTDKDAFEVTAFDINAPLIKRALIDRQLDKKDAKKPFDNVIKAKKIAGIVGQNLVLLTSIGDYQYDEAKRQVTLDITLRLVDFSGEKPKVEKYVAETATSPENVSKEKDEAKIAQDLLKELAEKLMKDLLKPKPVEDGKKP